MKRFIRVFKCARCGEIFRAGEVLDLHTKDPWEKVYYEHKCTDVSHGRAVSVGFDVVVEDALAGIE